MPIILKFTEGDEIEARLPFKIFPALSIPSIVILFFYILITMALFLVAHFRKFYWTILEAQNQI